MSKITSMDPKECEVCVELEAQHAEFMRLALDFKNARGKYARETVWPELDKAVRKALGLTPPQS